jgi:hypothetical protein
MTIADTTSTCVRVLEVSPSQDPSPVLQNFTARTETSMESIWEKEVY